MAPERRQVSGPVAPERRRARGADVIRRPAFALALLWLAARALYGVIGVRFDTRALDYAYQFVDLDLLRHDLGRSLWYSHAQPPLFNLLIGVTLRLPGTDLLLGLLFAALGLLVPLAILRTTRALGVGPSTAFAVAAVWAVAPVTALYEAYLFYSLPVAALLASAPYALLRFTATARPAWGLTFFGSLAALALTRASYHMLWLVPIVAVLVGVAPRFASRRTVLLVAMPLVLVVALYAKNAVVFGTSSASSWMGMNLARVTLEPADRDEIRRLQRDGTLSTSASVPPFSPVDLYELEPRGPRDVAVLNRERKQDGRPNLFHGEYVEVSEQYLTDSLRYARAHPGEYARSVAASLRYLFLPPSDYPFVDENWAEVRTLDRTTNAVVFLQPRAFDDPVALLAPRPGAPGLESLQWTAVVAYAGAAFLLPVVAARRIRGGGRRDLGRGLALAFVAYTVVTITAVNVLFEIGENNRFRFETDPLVFVSTGVLVDLVVRRVRDGAVRSRPDR